MCSLFLVSVLILVFLQQGCDHATSPIWLEPVYAAELEPSANLVAEPCSARFCHSPRLCRSGRTSSNRNHAVNLQTITVQIDTVSYGCLTRKQVSLRYNWAGKAAGSILIARAMSLRGQYAAFLMPDL